MTLPPCGEGHASLGHDSALLWVTRLSVREGFGLQQRPEVASLRVLWEYSPWFHPNARVNMEVLVSRQEASSCPLGFFPPSGWPRFQAWSTRPLPIQRPAACLPGPLPGLALPGDPFITPARWMQRVMAPLKRRTSPRLEASEGSCPHRPCIQLPPGPWDSHPTSSPTPVPCCPLLVKSLNNRPSPKTSQRGSGIISQVKQ